MTLFTITTQTTITVRRTYQVDADCQADAERIFAERGSLSPASEEIIQIHGDEEIENISEVSREPTVTLRFVPQAWLRDNTVEVDPAGPDEWEIPKSRFLSLFPRFEDFAVNFEARDDLRLEPTAPAWVRQWSGPFEVELAELDVKPWAA